MQQDKAPPAAEPQLQHVAQPKLDEKQRKRTFSPADSSMHDWPMATPTPTVCTCGERERGRASSRKRDGKQQGGGGHAAGVGMQLSSDAWHEQHAKQASEPDQMCPEQATLKKNGGGANSCADLASTSSKCGSPAHLVLHKAHGVVNGGALSLKAHRLAVGACGACTETPGAGSCMSASLTGVRHTAAGTLQRSAAWAQGAVGMGATPRVQQQDAQQQLLW